MIHFAMLALLCLQAPGADPPVPRLSSRGVWVLDSGGNPVPPHSFRRGYQPSGLVLRKFELWSVGDQRSEYPGHLFRIDPNTGRLRGNPIRLEAPGAGPEFEAYRAIPNSDFEGLCLDPKDPDTLYAVTEDKTPWIVEIRLEWKDASEPRARIVQLTRIQLSTKLVSWRDDPNFRFEGCTVSDDSKTMYLAFERDRTQLPLLCQVPLETARSGKPFEPEIIPMDFGAVPRRADKAAALLNLNDILFLRCGERPALLAIARDQERLLLLDLEKKSVARIVDLELLDPSGGPIYWVSPEGLAINPDTDGLWLINDPDSMGTNYRARDATAPSGHFADYSPLLFHLSLSQVLGQERKLKPVE